jgi:ribonuclease HII
MVGLDEVGRGCWAGPLLVVAARQTAKLPAGITDSKLLTKIQREQLFNLISISCKLGEGWVSSSEIDKSGLANALRLGIARALQNLGAEYEDEIIFDGKVNYVDPKFINAECVVDADLNIPIVSAASIYAKVVRDKFMEELGLKHPAYGFEKHVGYGTKAHLKAMSEQGILNGIHRTSFRPVAEFIKI